MRRPRPTSTLFPYTTLFRSRTRLVQFHRNRGPECRRLRGFLLLCRLGIARRTSGGRDPAFLAAELPGGEQDRKSTRLNSSHVEISYAVFCLKKKNIRCTEHA